VLNFDFSQPMASEQQVRQYLAYWFQLGKRVMIQNGQQALQPRSVIAGDRYSQEFEEAWTLIRASEAGECYLEGTAQTINELMSTNWEINPCARCSMPIPMRTIGLPPSDCPCSDLPNWPDDQMPQPRSPVNSQAQLLRIRDRLRQGQNS
jgi:hypothetical protein